MPASTFPAEWRTAALIILCLAGIPVTQAQDKWLPLAKDGIHDPKSPGVRQLQQPSAALSTLTPDAAGNMVRWVTALEKGEIAPRASIRPGTEVKVLDLDVLMNLKGGMPIVRFPHRAHTLWLDCANCHDHLFKAQAGANAISMFAILQGEQCGVCHGAVSFPLTECYRCHSVLRPGQSRPAVPPPLPGAKR
jgi:c(7)-type cytochrome triheme protein